MCPSDEWRHITEEKQQKCVSESEVETHYGGKTAKMCIRRANGDTLRRENRKKVVRSESGDTLRRKNSKKVYPSGEWKHITKEKQKESVSKVKVETHYEGKTERMCLQG